MQENLEIIPWVLKKIVLPQHTDHAGVMWHGSYMAWLEEARIVALKQAGLSYSFLSESGFEMPVVDLRIKYVKALFHGDQVLLNSWVYTRGGLKINWETKFFKADQEIAAKASVDLVLIKKDLSGVRLIRKVPVDLSKAIENLQKGPII